MKQKWISKNTLYYLAAWIPQMRDFLLSAFHLKAVAVLMEELIGTLGMTYCDNVGPNEKILHCFKQMLLGTCLRLAKH